MPAAYRLPDPFPCTRSEPEIRTDLAMQLEELLEHWSSALAADREQLRRGEQIGMRFHA